MRRDYSRDRINIPIDEFFRNVDSGQHGCIFTISKADKQNMLFNFVKSGIKNNWGVVYATATESLEEIRKSMQSYGINTKLYEKGESAETNVDEFSLILVRGEEIYKQATNPDIENWLNVIQSISNLFTSKGKKGLRVAADLSSYFISQGLWEQWQKLESSVERKLSLPISVLCAYDSELEQQIVESDIAKFYLNMKSEYGDFIHHHNYSIYTSGNKTIIFKL